PTELFVRDVHSRIDEPQQCGSKALLLNIPFDVRVHASGQVTQLSIDMIASGKYWPDEIEEPRFAHPHLLANGGNRIDWLSRQLIASQAGGHLQIEACLSPHQTAFVIDGVKTNVAIATPSTGSSGTTMHVRVYPYESISAPIAGVAITCRPV